MPSRQTLVATARFIQRALCVLCMASGPALAQPEAALVRVAEARLGQIDPQIRLTANVHAVNASQLSPKVNGLVTEVLHDVGSLVEQGTALIQIDEDLARLQLAELEAAVREAEARYENSLRLEEELESLIDLSHVSKTNYATQQSETKASRAGLDGLKARRDFQRELLSRHRVLAPFDAVISERNTEVGEWVTTGTQLMTLVNLSHLHIDMQIPERYINQIDAGARVAFSSKARPDLDLNTQISLVVPVINQDTRTFLARVVFDNSGYVLQPGMAVTAQISQNTEGVDVVQVPSDAIVRSADGNISVWKVTADGTELAAVPVEVEPGALVGDMTEIRSGNVEAGDRLVVNGNETLRPNQKIRIR